MRVGLAAIAAVLGTAMASVAVSQTRQSEPGGPPDPVVLELFTSQGCASCPPADRLMAQFAREPAFLVITRHVTYWDKLGWKDTMARKENTELQWAYAAKFPPGTGIYTPQVVVQGRGGVIGSKEQEIRKLVKKVGGADWPSLAISPQDGGLKVSISGKPVRSAELVLLAVDSSESVAVGSGENAGKTFTYTNVVRDELKLGDWRGGTQSFPIAASLLSVAQADRYAVLLRQRDGGPVLAAAMLPQARN